LKEIAETVCGYALAGKAFRSLPDFSHLSKTTRVIGSPTSWEVTHENYNA